MKEALTQNLGDLLEASGALTQEGYRPAALEKAKKDIRPEAGIDIIITSGTPVVAPRTPSFFGRATQTNVETGDKNIEAEGTAAKHNNISTEKNMTQPAQVNGNILPNQPMPQQDPQGQQLTPFELWAMQTTNQAVVSLGRIADKDIKVVMEQPKFERRNQAGSILVGAGIGCIVGGTAGGCIAGLIPARATMQDVLVGVGVGAGVGTVLGGAGGAIYASGEPKKSKSKKKSKKDDDEDDDS